MGGRQGRGPAGKLLFAQYVSDRIEGKRHGKKLAFELVVLVDLIGDLVVLNMFYIFKSYWSAYPVPVNCVGVKHFPFE